MKGTWRKRISRGGQWPRDISNGKRWFDLVKKPRQLLCCLDNRETGWRSPGVPGCPVWGLCLRHKHMPFSCFPLVLSLKRFLSGLPRTKERLTKVPPGGTIWKAIQGGFHAMSPPCPEDSLARPSVPDFIKGAPHFSCFTSFSPAAATYFSLRNKGVWGIWAAFFLGW